MIPGPDAVIDISEGAASTTAGVTVALQNGRAARLLARELIGKGLAAGFRYRQGDAENDRAGDRRADEIDGVVEAGAGASKVAFTPIVNVAESKEN